ncbi:MAG: hypothetical protein KDJ86_12360, partial [Bauldia sp.]|uniref:hypothetical protein n=1 Tax=Bauldia sp. TaxID=2575872 RepID=UPI001D29A1FB
KRFALPDLGVVATVVNFDVVRFSDLDGGEESPAEKVYFPNPNGGGISRIAEDAVSPWIFVFGSTYDYSVKLKKDDDSWSVEEVVRLPSHYNRVCGVFEAQCSRQEGQYSPLLRRAFLWGYPESWFPSIERFIGNLPETLEVSAGMTKQLTDADGEPLTYRGDAPTLGAVMLMDRQRWPHVYDGETILRARSDRPGQDSLFAWALADKPQLDRVELQTQRGSYQITRDGRLIPIDVPAKLAHDFPLPRFQVSIDGRPEVWIAEDHEIYFQTESEITRVFDLPPGQKVKDVSLDPGRQAVVLRIEDDADEKLHREVSIQLRDGAPAACRPIDASGVALLE